MKPLIHIRNPEEAAGFYDECINQSPNGLIYACSWYLNIVCPQWEILAKDDHTAVMPLPVFRSMGRKILKQPEYAWQLGVFSTRIPSPELVRHFIGSIPKAYRLRKFCLSKLNLLPNQKVRFLNAAELDLIRPYPQIRSGFGPSFQQQLKLASDSSLSFVKQVSVHDMLMFAYRLDKFNQQRLSPRKISILRMLATNAMQYRACQICAAYDRYNNLCATILFLVYHGRASILHAAATSSGLASGSIEYILDGFIKMNAEKNLVLSIDNPADRKLMEILQSCGCSISEFPCLRRIG